MKRQLSVEGSFLQAKKAEEDKTEFIVDTTEAFLSAGISVEKLDHPKMREWLGKYIKGSCDLPSVDRIEIDRKLVFAAVSKLFDPKTLGNQILSANNATVELKKLSYATAIIF
ncbi:hypothetical protein C0J52_02447 [Blattella germanica]|nr:hypothetical protein C0J52_02447 [Blattella germanica]